MSSNFRIRKLTKIKDWHVHQKNSWKLSNNPFLKINQIRKQKSKLNVFITRRVYNNYFLANLMS